MNKKDIFKTRDLLTSGMATILFLLLSCYSLYAQDKGTGEVSGVVMDKDGQTLPSVTINVVGDRQAVTSTDNEGEFKLEGVSFPAQISFFSVGYDTLYLDIEAEATNIKVILMERSSDLEEVIVVGLGTQRKVSVVGAVTTVDPRHLQSPSTSITNMLGGSVPGIIATSRSG